MDGSTWVDGLPKYGMPCTYRRSSRRQVLHWHLWVEQVHGRSQDGTALFGGLLLKYLEFINVRHLDNGEESRSLRISHIALLWRFTRKACRCGWGQERRTCGHVSTSLEVHNEHVMEGYLRGQKRCLRAFPIYWLVRNLINCFIWFSEICGLVQNSLDDTLSMLVSLVHLCILGKFWGSLVRWFSVVYFCRYLRKFLMGPLYCVP
jgi:hypothetical protein